MKAAHKFPMPAVSFHLTTSAKRRGRKPTPVDPRERKIAELERQLVQMTGRAERAERLVELQKKLAALLGRPLESERA